MPSVRDETSGVYDERTLAAEHLDRILEAGRRSPSASNRQPWDFVLVTDPGSTPGALDCLGGAGHLAAAKAAIVLMLGEPEAERYLTIDQYDLGQATMAMMLAATDLASGAVTRRLATRTHAGGSSGCPTTGTALTCWHSATRRTARSDESRTPTDGPSTTSSTGGAGSASEGCAPGSDVDSGARSASRRHETAHEPRRGRVSMQGSLAGKD